MQFDDSGDPWKAFDRGHYRLARSACARLLRRRSIGDVERRDLRYLLAKIYLKLSRWKLALKTLIEINGFPSGSSCEYWSVLGEAFQNCRKFLCALSCYNLALANTPDREQINSLEHKLHEFRDGEGSAEERAMVEVFLTPRHVRGKYSSLFQHVQEQETEILRALYAPRGLPSSESYIHILRENSSFVPILRGTGGGYLIAHGGLGFIVDPGHDFIQNFFAAGYGLGDIRGIIVTHAHDDHVADLPAISSLLNKARLSYDMGGWPIDLYIDQSTLAAFGRHYMLRKDGCFRLHPTLRPGGHRVLFREQGFALQMDIYRAKHEIPVCCPRAHRHGRVGDFKEGVGLGFRFTFPDCDTKHVLMPSDTGWDEQICRQYSGSGAIDAAILHMSSVKPCERQWLLPDVQGPEYFYRQHLGLLGVVRFIEDIRPHKIILAERGAELNHVWDELARIIADACGRNHDDVYASQLGARIAVGCAGIHIVRPNRSPSDEKSVWFQ